MPNYGPINDSYASYQNHISFLKSNGKEYPKSCEQNFPRHIGDDIRRGEIPSFMEAIYCLTGVITPEFNRYLAILKFLKENFYLGCNILEIAAGIYPILSKYINEQQKMLGKGTVTAMDPLLMKNKLGNIQQSNEKFTNANHPLSTNVETYDLLVSHHPCAYDLSLVYDIIYCALNNKKDLLLSLCSCPHGYGGEAMVPPEEWQKSVIDTVDGEISILNLKAKYQILYLPDKYEDPGPIIVIKHDKQKRLLTPYSNNQINKF